MARRSIELTVPVRRLGASAGAHACGLTLSQSEHVHVQHVYSSSDRPQTFPVANSIAESQAIVTSSQSHSLSAELKLLQLKPQASATDHVTFATARSSVVREPCYALAQPTA